ncbi:MAG: hypothetical protein RMZ43_034235 [Nostoc sp. CmiVER01]|nr:hypothetical protein [Nostoc sp. CmiVER01]MDZ8123274.1 hypothetical protein [Nostoc sp. CmiVER01]
MVNQFLIKISAPIYNTNFQTATSTIGSLFPTNIHNAIATQYCVGFEDL